MSATSFVASVAEAVGALAAPVGGGVYAYVKWRKSSERERRAREEAAKIAADKATFDARSEEKNLRAQILQDKDKQIADLKLTVAEANKKIEQLNTELFRILIEGRSKYPPQEK